MKDSENYHESDIGAMKAMKTRLEVLQKKNKVPLSVKSDIKQKIKDIERQIKNPQNSQNSQNSNPSELQNLQESGRQRSDPNKFPLNDIGEYVRSIQASKKTIEMYQRSDISRIKGPLRSEKRDCDLEKVSLKQVKARDDKYMKPGHEYALVPDEHIQKTRVAVGKYYQTKALYFKTICSNLELDCIAINRKVSLQKRNKCSCFGR